MARDAITRATLGELLSRLSRFEPDPVAELFADTVEWDGPGDSRVPWTGARSSPAEVADPGRQRRRWRITPCRAALTVRHGWYASATPE